MTRYKTLKIGHEDCDKDYYVADTQKNNLNVTTELFCKFTQYKDATWCFANKETIDQLTEFANAEENPNKLEKPLSDIETRIEEKLKTFSNKKLLSLRNILNREKARPIMYLCSRYKNDKLLALVQNELSSRATTLKERMQAK